MLITFLKKNYFYGKFEPLVTVHEHQSSLVVTSRGVVTVCRHRIVHQNTIIFKQNFLLRDEPCGFYRSFNFAGAFKATSLLYNYYSN
jgi:hypothetical protein